MAENIPKAAKERYQPQIQETQLTLGKINTKKPHILGTWQRNHENPKLKRKSWIQPEGKKDTLKRREQGNEL